MALDLGSLGVSGVGSSYTVDAPLTMSNFQTTISLGGELNLNANYTGFGPLQINTAGSSLNLNAGTLTATSVGVTGSAVLTAQNNMNTSAAFVSGLRHGAECLSVARRGQWTDAARRSDPGPGGGDQPDLRRRRGPGPIDYAFRWAGNHVAALTPLLGTRITVTGAAQPVSVIYDPDQVRRFYLHRVHSFDPRKYDGDSDLDVTDASNSIRTC